MTTTVSKSRGFIGSGNIPESYDFRSQFLLLNIIFHPSLKNTFLLAYTFGIKSIKKKFVNLKSKIVKI